VVREIQVKRGVLTARTAVQETKTYTIKNVDAKAKTLVLEHPQRYGYTLLERKAAETTPSAYRFEVPLAASGTTTFALKEERLFDQTNGISNVTPDVMTSYLQNKSLSDNARRQLQEIAQKKNQIAANDAAFKSATDEFTSLTQDQGRIRSNIESLNRVSGQQDQVQQYARQLAMTETRLAQLRDTQSNLRKQKATLDGELAALIDKAEF
jgi:RNase adaptor protein for sRNA GlmZ degradation